MKEAKVTFQNWGFPTRVWFGEGRIKDLSASLTEIGASNPLLVTDAGLAKLPVFQSALRDLGDANVPFKTFAAVYPNPNGDQVSAGVEAFQTGGHDAVVIMGGGSAIDAGKAIAFMVGQSRPIWDFEDKGDNWKRGNTNNIAPCVVIPTTAGTGSEFGRASVITDDRFDAHRKVVIYHPAMMPELVIMDPSLTYELPPHLTAATGMDALSHALEAYCVPSFHPMSDALSLHSLEMIKEALPRAYKNGHDREARANMLVASGMAAVAFQKGLGGMHAVSHALGARFDAHHGMLNAVLMPHILRVNREAIEAKLVSCAKTLELAHTADAFLDWIAAIRRTLNIPDSLAEIGVRVDDIDQLADVATRDVVASGNPIPLSKDLATTILKAAM